ncbi:MAG TPA: ABC transporter permease [Thermoanaerobaculia bacterium]|nr:ABC transporter permease [Thermoanaerobaculia bacterium]
MLQDLLFGIRLLRRSPGFSLLAISCLTLGIGATTAACGWIEGILLRPFPAVADQDRMVAMAGTASRSPRFDDVSWPDLQDFRRSCKLMDWFIVDRITGTTLNVGDRAERATGSVVSANYFSALGVRPILGRGFEPAEEVGRNAHPVTVIAYRTWKERYGGDPGVIGRTQMLNGTKHTIVGVAPPGFYGTFVGYAFAFWVPASMQETFDSGGYKLEDRGARWIEGFARLKPGVSLEQAQAEISAVAGRLATAYPDTNRGRGVKLLPLWQTPFNNAATLLPTLKITFAVACLVLLIACANVGNLLLVRAFGRRHEMTVRLAVGAGRGRLLRQVLTEGLILSALGAAGGLVAAFWCRNLMVLMFPVRRGVAVNLPAEIDWRVMAVCAGVCVLATLLCGLVPALQAGKVDLAGAMKAESGGVVGGRGRAWVRGSLVLVQVALSFALLVGGGLLVESLREMQRIDPGFSTRGVLVSSIDLVSAGYDAQRAESFRDRLIERVQALGGVESAVFSRVAPFTYPMFSSAPIAVAGYVAAPDEQPTVEYDEVGPGYLATTGIPLVSGREFARADDQTAPPVAVVNQAMVAKYWRGEDPVGKRLQVKGRFLQVIGVARTVKYQTLLEAPKPFFYVPMRQSVGGQLLQIRTRLRPETLAPALAREIHALDASLAPSELITMQELVDRMSWQRRAAVVLLFAFGGLALALAAVGLYGVMSYAVAQSTRELGLRMALGAGAPDLLRLVMTHGMALTAGGVALGAGAALALTRLMGDMLYKISPRDPLAFGSALAVMAVVALAACLLPAWRATRTDPVRALRI